MSVNTLAQWGDMFQLTTEDSKQPNLNVGGVTFQDLMVPYVIGLGARSNLIQLHCVKIYYPP